MKIVHWRFLDDSWLFHLIAAGRKRLTSNKPANHKPNFQSPTIAAVSSHTVNPANGWM